MIDRTNESLSAEEDIRSEAEMGDHDSQWYGTDPDGHIPPDDGLRTVDVKDMDF